MGFLSTSSKRKQKIFDMEHKTDYRLAGTGVCRLCKKRKFFNCSTDVTTGMKGTHPILVLEKLKTANISL